MLSGSVVADGALAVQAGTTVTNSGSLMGDQGVSIQTPQAIENRGYILSGAQTTLSATESIHNHGLIVGDGGMQLDSGQRIHNHSDAQIYAGGDLQTQTGQAMLNEGRIGADGDIRLETRAADGRIHSTAGSVLSAGMDPTGAVPLGQGNLSLHGGSAGAIDLKGLTLAGQSIQAQAGSLNLDGQDLLTQRMDLQAAEAELQAVLERGRGEYRQIAEMELANAEVKHAALSRQIASGEILAPFSGIVVQAPGISAEEAAKGPLQTGSRVSQGQPLFGLASIEGLRVIARVAELDVNQLKEGQPVDVTGDGFDDQHLQGKVMAVGGQALGGSVPGGSSQFEVVVSIPELDEVQMRQVRLGMSAKRITVSTSGIPKMIKKLADDEVKFKLAVGAAHTYRHQRYLCFQRDMKSAGFKWQ